MKRKEFGLCFITKDQIELAEYFGSVSGREVDKFKEKSLKIFRGESINVPLLEDSALCIECKLLDHRTIADHTTFVARILKAYKNKDAPIERYNESFYALIPMLG